MRPSKNYLYKSIGYFYDKNKDGRYFFLTEDQFNLIDSLGYTKWVILVYIMARNADGDPRVRTRQIASDLNLKQNEILPELRYLEQNDFITKYSDGYSSKIEVHSKCTDPKIIMTWIDFFTKYCGENNFVIDFYDEPQLITLNNIIALYGTDTEKVKQILDSKISGTPKECDTRFFGATLAGKVMSFTEEHQKINNLNSYIIKCNFKLNVKTYLNKEGVSIYDEILEYLKYSSDVQKGKVCTKTTSVKKRY